MQAPPLYVQDKYISFFLLINCIACIRLLYSLALKLYAFLCYIFLRIYLLNTNPRILLPASNHLLPRMSHESPHFDLKLIEFLVRRTGLEPVTRHL